MMQLDGNFNKGRSIKSALAQTGFYSLPLEDLVKKTGLPVTGTFSDQYL